MSKPFKLKSGNNTSFKMMGSNSPIQWHKPGHEKTFLQSLQSLGQNIRSGKAIFGGGEGQIPATTKEREMQEEKYAANLAAKNEPKVEEVVEETTTVDKPYVEGSDRTHDIKITQKEGNLPNEQWSQVIENVEQSGHDMDDLLEKQKTLDKDSDEWKANQDIINAAYGVEKRHVTSPATFVQGEWDFIEDIMSPDTKNVRKTISKGIKTGSKILSQIPYITDLTKIISGKDEGKKKGSVGSKILSQIPNIKKYLKNK